MGQNLRMHFQAGFRFNEDRHEIVDVLSCFTAGNIIGFSGYRDILQRYGASLGTCWPLHSVEPDFFSRQENRMPVVCNAQCMLWQRSEVRRIIEILYPARYFILIISFIHSSSLMEKHSHNSSGRILTAFMTSEQFLHRSRCR